MNLRKHIILAAAATSLVIGSALPASAADTTTTFSLTGGALTLSVAAGPAALGDEAAGIAANTITGSLTAASVTDERGSTAGWSVTASSTVFTGTGLSSSEAAEYVPNTVAFTGDSTITETTSSIQAPLPAANVVAAASSGVNTASWTPTLNVSMPGSALAGDYTAVVTTSIS